MTKNKKKARSSKPEIKTYRSGLERGVAKQLMLAEVTFKYEHEKLPYIRGGGVHRYTPDFVIGDEIIIEAKGVFGHIGNEEACLRERNKLILVRDQHPEREIRLVFEDAKQTTKDGLDLCRMG